MSGIFGEKLRVALGCKCAGKRRYATYAEAVDVAKRRLASDRDPPKVLQPHACEHGCGGFHITSRPFRDRIARFPVLGDWDPDVDGGDLSPGA